MACAATDPSPLPRVLLVEDDDEFAEALASALGRSGFEVSCAADGLAGLELARSQAWSAVVLDLMVPTLDGAEILRRLRAESCVPVLVLTAKHRLEEKVARLEEGADDYLTKPVELPELVARLHALIRRATGATARNLILNELEVDLDDRIVRRSGERIDLTSTELRLLELLARERGRAVSTERIALALAASGDPIAPATVRGHVLTLRAKLGDGVVKTRRGLGYFLPAAR